MSANPQWDVSKALAVARLFHLLCGARDACVAPFLTLYLRHLGLAAPWVGILMGTKHLLATTWAPVCSFLAKNYQKRQLLLTGSLLGSAAAGLLLTLVSPLDKDLVYQYCNGTNSLAAAGVLLQVMLPVNTTLERERTPNHSAQVKSFTRFRTPGQELLPVRPLGSDRETIIQKERFTALSALPGSYFEKTSLTVPATAPPLMDEVLEVEASPRKTQRSLVSPSNSGIIMGKGDPWNNMFGTTDPTLPVFHVVSELEIPGTRVNLSLAERTRAQDRNLAFPLEGERWIFLLSMMVVLFWELLSAPLGPAAADSLYEYLDFVDATDCYGRLWVWRLLGMSVGVCAVPVLVGRLDCFLTGDTPWTVVHFYVYTLLSILALPVSFAIPIPNSKRRESSHKAIKTLSLIGSDCLLVLLAVTVFLTGAAVANIENFLFWQMHDQGSSELIMGFSVTLSLVSEILLHPFKAKMLKNLSSLGTLGLGLGCLSGQLLYYSLLWNWWAIFPAQVFGAISNGALWWAVDALVEDLVIPGTERSLSVMLRGLFYGNGASLGSFVGGFVVLHYSLDVLYKTYCVILSFWLVLFMTVQSKLPQQRKINYSKVLTGVSDSEEGAEGDWLIKALRDEYLTGRAENKY
ncbi:major facilitator superfamily domain-containing protein 6-like [Phascolarctos cinereus]|uniref:Major facilitator superfamily domain-containing protein 6-like n=1 Tax=Phascolarctos cinereus TaxID=38626 RepID=A0A6P5IUK8_PHACI|nr:major facilitator superfamily domain-containing protein 6-like [Phascolarctos cinereus]